MDPAGFFKQELEGFGMRVITITQFSNGYRHHSQILQVQRRKSNFFHRLLGLDWISVGSFSTSSCLAGTVDVLLKPQEYDIYQERIALALQEISNKARSQGIISDQHRSKVIKVDTEYHF